MKKAVVTGGLGFIGFHLVERLALEGVEVRIIDEIPEGKREEYEEKWMRIGRNSLITLIDEKVENINIEKEVRNADVIYHLAATTSADNKWPKLVEVIENNVKLTKKLLEVCPKSSRFIYASTVEVYGERPGIITERTPANPTSAYGITKLASEEMIKKECKKRGTTYMILRLPTIYGPWQRSDMTYQQILMGVEKPATDRSTLDALFVHDCVDALLLAATSEHINETFHISSGIEDAWYKGVKLLQCNEIFERYIKTTLDPKKALSLLGFNAKTSLEEGLAKQREHVTQLQQKKI